LLHSLHFLKPEYALFLYRIVNQISEYFFKKSIKKVEPLINTAAFCSFANQFSQSIAIDIRQFLQQKAPCAPFPGHDSLPKKKSMCKKQMHLIVFNTIPCVQIPIACSCPHQGSAKSTNFATKSIFCD